MSRDITEDQLRMLNPTDVRWYAVGLNWKQMQTKNRSIILLQHPTRHLHQIVIPTSGIKDNNLPLLYEAIRTLADDEQRSPRDLLKDLLAPPADIMQLRVQSDSAGSGSIPLSDGLALLQSGRNLLLAAACSAHQPQAAYARQSFAPAQEFLRKCLLGQTERGSFVATILSPVPASGPRGLFSDETDTIETAPYQRRVTLLLMQGIGLVRSALDQASPERVIDNVVQGVSANLCDALTGVKLFDSRSIIEVNMKWSRTRPAVPILIPDRVAFTQGEFPYIEAAGRALRNTFEPRRERVIGHVINLHAEPSDLFQPFKGEVILRALIADQSARVRVQLEQSEYLEACRAHSKREQIEVTGVLNRNPQAKLYELQQMQGFRILQNIDEQRNRLDVELDRFSQEGGGNQE